MFPRAPIYTAVYDSAATGGVFEGRTIRTSFLQKMPLAKSHHHMFSFFMPYAFEQFDLSGFDLVVSVSASFAKGIITKPGVRHICYCLTPPRFLWDDSQKFVQEFGYPRLIKSLIPPLLSYLRVWDRQAAHRVTDFTAISEHVRVRISKYYRRDAGIVYPPVDAEKFAFSGERQPGDFYLMAGRLVAYKKFDLGVRACTQLNLPLKIVGDGIEMSRLKKISGPNVEFMGQVDDATLAGLYRSAKGLIFPQEEDFGIVPLEAMAAGCPVLAYRAGGAIETVEEGVTGMFFNEQTPESMVEALEIFNKMKFNPDACLSRARKFDIPVFQEKMMNLFNL